VLRAVALAFGLCVLGVAVVLAAIGAPGRLCFQVGVPGLIITVGMLVERWRYKKPTRALPGPGWVASEERFVDPETGKVLTVFYQAQTGERRYVEV
jgi:hypothetical protein